MQAEREQNYVRYIDTKSLGKKKADLIQTV